MQSEFGRLPESISSVFLAAPQLTAAKEEQSFFLNHHRTKTNVLHLPNKCGCLTLEMSVSMLPDSEFCSCRTKGQSISGDHKLDSPCDHMLRVFKF